MFYDKRIKYLDYCEKGEKVKSGGFVRIEIRDEILRIDVTSRNLPLEGEIDADVILTWKDNFTYLGEIRIVNGNGVFHYECGISEEGIEYAKLREIQIVLGEGRELYGVLEERTRQPERSSEIIAADKQHSETVFHNTENSGQVIASENKRVEKADKEVDKEAETEQPILHLLDDKWLQVSSIYPHVKPFRDNRDFLSVTPADFVLLTANSYRTANNSFLLHGYYNYKHLVLTRIEKRGEILYYLGVPGNYFDREKQVAVMFGFESFECAEEPAQEGDFGYYMIRVQL